MALDEALQVLNVSTIQDVTPDRVQQVSVYVCLSTLHFFNLYIFIYMTCYWYWIAI